jgi:hypothetical protein
MRVAGAIAALWIAAVTAGAAQAPAAPAATPRPPPTRRSIAPG